MRLDGRVSFPRALDGVLRARVDARTTKWRLRVSAVVTREGRIADYDLLQSERAGDRAALRAGRRDEVTAVLDAVKRSRFAPAEAAGGTKVAVNMVWLLVRTTAARYRASRCPSRARPAVGAGPGCRETGRDRRRAGLSVPSTDAGGACLNDRLTRGGASPRALATLFSASVARMITPRAAASPSSTSSNCSARESAMPSRG